MGGHGIDHGPIDRSCGTQRVQVLDYGAIRSQAPYPKWLLGTCIVVFGYLDPQEGKAHHNPTSPKSFEEWFQPPLTVLN